MFRMSRKKSELLSALVESLGGMKLRVRVKLLGQDQISEWSKWISIPSPSYFEMEGFLPLEIECIEWLEVESSGSRYVGRLIPPKKFDVTETLIKSFRGMELDVSQSDGQVRIEFPRP
jgi:hypothetical protein